MSYPAGYSMYVIHIQSDDPTPAEQWQLLAIGPLPEHWCNLLQTVIWFDTSVTLLVKYEV